MYIWRPRQHGDLCAQIYCVIGYIPPVSVYAWKPLQLLRRRRRTHGRTTDEEVRLSQWPGTVLSCSGLGPGKAFLLSRRAAIGWLHACTPPGPGVIQICGSMPCRPLCAPDHCMVTVGCCCCFRQLHPEQQVTSYLLPFFTHPQPPLTGGCKLLDFSFASATNTDKTHCEQLVKAAVGLRYSLAWIYALTNFV